MVRKRLPIKSRGRKSRLFGRDPHEFDAKRVPFDPRSAGRWWRGAGSAVFRVGLGGRCVHGGCQRRGERFLHGVHRRLVCLSTRIAFLFGSERGSSGHPEKPLTRVWSLFVAQKKDHSSTTGREAILARSMAGWIGHRRGAESHTRRCCRPSPAGRGIELSTTRRESAKVQRQRLLHSRSGRACKSCVE